MRSKFGIVLIAIVVLLSWAVGVSSRSSDPWHTAGLPQVIAQDIQFSSGDAHLVGTVYFPKNGTHLPAVVVLHHAAVAAKEAELYRHLREGLPMMGFAVLIYDRRGTGQSGGNPQSADYETLADDAIAGQHALAKLSCIDANRIGFGGLSQGGWLAVLAAGRSKDAAFAISVSASLVTAEEQMEFATSNLLMVRGYSHGDVQEMLETRKAWIGYLHGANSRDVALEALRKAESRPWFDLVYLPKPSQLTSDPEHDPTCRRLDARSCRSGSASQGPNAFRLRGFRPLVPVAKSVARLQSLISTATRYRMCSDRTCKPRNDDSRQGDHASRCPYEPPQRPASTSVLHAPGILAFPPCCKAMTRIIVGVLASTPSGPRK